MSDLRIAVSALHSFCCDALQAANVPPEDARLVADSLAQADARGLNSHGVVRLLPIYTQRLRAGTTRARPRICIERQRGAVTVVDGDAGMGQVTGTFAMRTAIDLARGIGAGIVGVRNSSHFGFGAMYVEQAVAAGMIGVALTNAPSNMPPWGGRTPYFGTNPIAVGIPCGQERPIILDMSTSVVARGKIVMAQKKGESIPPDWAIDVDGQPTTDAAAALAGAVLPFGGYKGSGLALLVDVLSGVLTGAAFGLHIINLYDEGERTQNLGHFFVALDPSSFLPAGDFEARMDQFVREVRCQPRMPDVDRIYLPGEIEFEQAEESARSGVVLPDAGVTELDQLAIELGIRPLQARAGV
ncbi:MAG: Ldh family oxidoreductase [Chloroflexota bacterium]|nr:Ldh family oxidoreductase [Chloroflexota bacterium]